MFDIFQFDIPFLAPAIILLIMGSISLIFSIILHSKSRAIKKLPKDLSANVFNKTFNVFDPYPEQRKVIHSFIMLLPFIIVFGSLIFTFVILVKIIEMGLILSVIVSIICLGLIMLDEAFEINKNAGILVNAVKNKDNLGKGDLVVFALVKATLPKLRIYYLSLAIVFLASSFVLPYIVPQFLFGFAMFAGLLFEIATYWGYFAPFAAYITTFLFVIVIIVVQLAVKRIKNRIMGLPSVEPASSSIVRLQFDGMKAYSTSRSLTMPEPKEKNKEE